MKLEPLVPTPRRNNTDCGVCAIATIANIPYEWSIRVLLSRRKKHSPYAASIGRMYQALLEMGFEIKKVSKPDFHKMKNHALLIVKVPYSGYKRGWDYHAVVWDAVQKVIWDPVYEGQGSHVRSGTGYYQNLIHECFEVKKIS